MAGSPDVVRQRQTGQVAAATIGYHDGQQYAAESERLRKARLRVEKAIKVRGSVPQRPEMARAGICAPVAQQSRLAAPGAQAELAAVPQEKKIFTVHGPYPVIRRLLRARGWVERKLPLNHKQLKQQPADQRQQQPDRGASGGGDEQGEAALNPPGGAQPSPGTAEPLQHPWCTACDKENEGEREDEDENEDKEQCSEDSEDIHDLMSFLVQDQVPNFLWTIRLSSVDRELLARIEVVNRYPRLAALCTKEGLCQSLQNLSWFEQVDFNTFFPRCYRLGFKDEKEAFIDDFCLTAARSLLKLALQKVGDRPVGTEQPSKPDEVPAGPCSPLYPDLLEEALEVCEQHLGVLGHQDIDRSTPSPCRTCIDWDRFLPEYYRVAHEGARLELDVEQRERCQELLLRLEEKLPQLGIEGSLNVWIVKPSAKSRGRGIVCATRLEEVLELAQSCVGTPAGVCEWVVQKYVERPLTIFNTKFDIRQWFVVTDWKPLTVWFYRDCYLRFCSRPFSLCHLEPARHLCNVSIQKRYKTWQPDPRVPPDKIWSNKQFQAHLAWLGRANAWQRVMVPGMKAAILNALRCARDQVGSRKGSFELFGADFLIGEDLQPWLLEINSCPTMSPSSAVTRQLCANVQRDTLRLVLDRKDNPTCSIGAFELLYREAAVSSCLTVGLRLMVTGCSLKKPQSAKRRSQDRLPRSAPSGNRAAKVHGSRASREKLPPMVLQGSCCLPKSDPPALPRAPPCSAGSQELPWLLHLDGQSGEAQPLTSSCSVDRVPGPPSQGATRSPQRPPGHSAGDQELPWLLHVVVGQPQEAQAQTALQPTASSCPLHRGPVPPPRGATRSPCLPPGGSAKSQELLHAAGQAEDAEAQLARPQEAQPPTNSCPRDGLSPRQEAPRRPRRPPGRQGLPRLSQPGGQPQAARPQRALPPISARPPVRGPVPQPPAAPSRPWRPPGCAPTPPGLPARPARLPAL
ncbi:tubulin tyrosine ligase 3-like [Melozone crissalis]|uniref:tubulin tyrosine ligase 3-like n=1 Tax=Melozone crissalis TaxID=40204 RepID=UPI0023DCA669|nr:tubulin tyrosine ligase 3-like [Melozone crissalis]